MIIAPGGSWDIAESHDRLAGIDEGKRKTGSVGASPEAGDGLMILGGGGGYIAAGAGATDADLKMADSMSAAQGFRVASIWCE